MLPRIKSPAFTWWLLIGVLPLAVWFGIQLGAAPQANQPKDGEKPKWTSLRHDSASVAEQVDAPLLAPATTSEIAAPQRLTSSSAQIASGTPVQDDRPSPEPSMRDTPISQRRPLAAARIPLVFRQVDPVAVGLSDLDVANIHALQERFEAQIGPQDANDPAYHRRWVLAQSSVDQELRAKLGWSLFSRYQIQAAKAQ